MFDGLVCYFQLDMLGLLIEMTKELSPIIFQGFILCSCFI